MMFNNCILFNTKKLDRQLSCIAEEEFKQINMHHSYAYILTVIASYEVVKTKTISCELGLDSSTVTRMVKKLEDNGYVLKGSENSRVDISLTAKGREKMPEVKAAWDSYHKRLEQLLGELDIESLNDDLKQVNQKICENN